MIAVAGQELLYYVSNVSCLYTTNSVTCNIYSKEDYYYAYTNMGHSLVRTSSTVYTRCTCNFNSACHSSACLGALNDLFVCGSIHLFTLEFTGNTCMYHCLTCLITCANGCLFSIVDAN